MTNIDGIKLFPNSTIKEALSIIDSGAIKIALVVDENDKLLGTITDGDIRRAILNGNSFRRFDRRYLVDPEKHKESLILGLSK